MRERRARAGGRRSAARRAASPARPCRRRTACRRARARRPGSAPRARRRGRCGSGSGSGSPRLRRGGELDRVDDLHVARAAAEVAEQGVGDLLARRLGMLREQRLGLHHDPGRAVAALRGAGGDEAVGPQPPGLLGQPLLGDDVLPRDARRLLGAGDDRACRRRSPCRRRRSPPARSRPSPSAGRARPRSSSSRLSSSRGSRRDRLAVERDSSTGSLHRAEHERQAAPSA